MRITILFITLLSFLASCQDKKNILVSGKITDEITGQPIPNAEVVVLCWFMAGWGDASYEKQTIITDKSGNYKVHFAKGHQVDVASKASGFNADRDYLELSDNKVEANLRLSRTKENPTLIKLLNTDHAGGDIPFLKVRIPYTQYPTASDLENVQTFGFDFLSLSITTDTLNRDVWFKPIVKDTLGMKVPYILMANRQGGIIPVYSNEIKSSFLYDKPNAPKEGYFHEYEFKGNEDGFFVLCRDGRTYGKIIFVKSRVSSGGSDESGDYTDFGRHFSCLYQPNGTTDLSFSTPDIDLEDYLVDYRLR